MRSLQGTPHRTAALLGAALSLSLSFTLLTGCGGSESETSGAPQPGDPDFVRDPGLDVENRSAAGETRSHNQDQNCLHCHQPLGPGKGLFTVAGTLHGPDGAPHTTGGKVMITSEASGEGELIASLDVDALGNFFTTDPMPFPEKEVFPFVVSADGKLGNAMPFSTISGSCNMCHVGSASVRLQKLAPSP